MLKKRKNKKHKIPGYLATKRRPLILIFPIVSICLFVLITHIVKRNRVYVPDNTGVVAGKFDESVFKTEGEWRKLLTPAQYHILREKGTEVPFTGLLTYESRKGTYYSVGCDVPLFPSDTKYDSGTGWPSFRSPVSPDAVVLRKEPYPDDRIEVLDPCGGHLGHVFDDGPPPTGKRYCINSLALRFVPEGK